MSKFSFLDIVIIGLTLFAIVVGILLIITNIKSIKDAKRMSKSNDISSKKSSRKYPDTVLTTGH